MTRNAQQRIFDELRRLFEPLVLKLGTAAGRRDALTQLGWRATNIPDFPEQALLELATHFAEAFETKIVPAAQTPPRTLEELGRAIEGAAAVQTLLVGLADIFSAGGVRPEGFAEAGRQLVNLAFVDYLRQRHPALFPLFDLLTLIQPREIEPVRDATGTRYLRQPRTLVEFAPGRLAALIRDPNGTLEEAYVVRRADGSLIASDTAARLFPKIAALGQGLSLPVVYGFDPSEGVDFGAFGNAWLANSLVVFVPMGADLIDESVGFAIALALDDDVGVVVRTFGNVTLRQAVGSWGMEIALAAGATGFAVGRHGVVFPEGAGLDSASLRIDATRIYSVATADQVPPLLIGSVDGTRLEVQTLQLAAEAGFRGQERTYGGAFELRGAALVIKSAEGDGLLAKLFPQETRVGFELGLGWDNQRGIYFRGGGGLDVAVPVDVSIGGVLDIRELQLSIAAQAGDNTEEQVRLSATATAAVKLGPVQLAVERTGLQARLGFPPDGGLGVATLDLTFQLPSGAGVTIDAGPIVGGGFLTVDREAGRYAGALQLRLYDISAAAFGVIDTRLPGGVEGFSFMVLISAEFAPIQLGLGFTLNGVGGALGIDRGVAKEALDRAVRSGRLEHILFPKNPAARAPEILADLEAYFPPAEGRYTFGPLAKIGWSTPTILEADLGIILELPQPVRLTLLGTIRAGLPSVDQRLVKLTMAVLGELDFEHKRLRLDASLYDSQVGGFPVSGDMAMRLAWGRDASFALAVGGFHPAFEPPAGFPALRPVTLEITRGGNPRITCLGYLAITSNTAQVGANAELRAGGQWNIYGWIGFDALFVFAPFAFDADFTAGVALRRGTSKKASVSVRGQLRGPNPWYARGKACVSLVFSDVCVSFEATLSQKRPEVVAPVPSRLTDVLVPAVREARNWSALLPPSSDRVVSRAPANGSFLDPLGTAVLRQTVLPLEESISRFASQTLAADQVASYTIDAVTLRVPGADTVITDPPTVRERFARAQFQDLADATKLSLPAFEPMVAGIQVPAGALRAGRDHVAELDYQTFVVQGEGDVATEPLPAPYRPGDGIPETLAGQSASATRGVRTTGSRKFARALTELPPIVRLADEGFTIASTRALAPIADPAHPIYQALHRARRTLGTVPKGKARAILHHYLADHPGERGTLQVVSDGEIAAA